MTTITAAAHGLSPSDIQTVLLGDRDTHLAYLVLLHFEEPAAARRWLGKLATCVKFGVAAGQVRESISIAFTHEGLRALQLPFQQLSTFPQAFRDGMGARHERLGETPLRAEGSWFEAAHKQGVHALVMIHQHVDDSHPLWGELLEEGAWAREHAARARAAKDSAAPGPTPKRALLSQLARATPQQVCAQYLPMDGFADAVLPLAVRLLHRPLVKLAVDKAGRKSDAERAWGIEYFGFREGREQTKLIDKQALTDLAKQVFEQDAQPLLNGGSYLVLRQLEQDTNRFWSAMAQANHADPLSLAEKVVGRRLNGARLDESAAGCPFNAHAARVNPRVESDSFANPTLLRRGLSYLDDGKCGLLFIAANRDIESQFEFIQHNWIQRGNHVGQTSDSRDPLAGLGTAKASFTTRLAGQTLRASFEPFVSLVWGGYFFMPSRAGLNELCRPLPAKQDDDMTAARRAGGVMQAPPQEHGAAPDAEQAELRQIQAWLDDARTAHEFWSSVRSAGTKRVANHAFVADADAVAEILGDTGERFSVVEYGRRMAPTLGPFFLGMDACTRQYQVEQSTARIVDEGKGQGLYVRRLAYVAALEFARLAAARIALRKGEDPHAPAAFSAAGMLAFVLDRASNGWFGLPGPSGTALAGWGRDLAQYFFRFHPNGDDANRAKQAAWNLRAHVDGLVRTADASAHPVGQEARLRETLGDMQTPEMVDDDAVLEDYARNLLGIVTGALGASLKLFVEGLSFYTLENQAEFSWPKAEADSYTSLFDAVIRAPLARGQRGGPDALYRTYRGEKPWTSPADSAAILPGDLVVVWLGGGLKQAPVKATEDVMFGLGPHRCPARWMGIAIIDGLLQCLTEIDGSVVVRPDGPAFVFTGDSWQKLVPVPGAVAG